MDSTLEDEVGTECTGKYGAVTGVVIFEVTEPGFPAEQAVRIFVAFERQEAAIKVGLCLGSGSGLQHDAAGHQSLFRILGFLADQAVRIFVAYELQVAAIRVGPRNCSATHTCGLCS